MIYRAPRGMIYGSAFFEEPYYGKDPGRYDRRDPFINTPQAYIISRKRYIIREADITDPERDRYHCAV